MAQHPEAFGSLLRQMRHEARLTQEELAERAGVSVRSVSDLERGINTTARRDTVRRLADALGLVAPARMQLEEAARGRPMPVTSEAAVMRTLPRDIASFTGRQHEVAALVTAAASGTGEILTISGMAGVGKTALAVHVAHQLADRFPDGQAFLTLHAHTPGQQPRDPSDALASLLLTAGVPPHGIPERLEERSGLWRSHLAGRRLLLLLDDAASSAQVKPLLPATAGSLVLVTTRRHLTALEDARAISLDTLPLEDAAALLVRLAGRPGLDPRDPAVADITALCGYLPLAIGMLARQLHHHPAWTPAVLAAELTAARDRLALMSAEYLSVAAAFDLSYCDLSGEEQQLFRRLGLHPGIDIDAYAAAALGDIGLAAARRNLEALFEQHLLAEAALGRYRMHDLIREHARTLATADPAADRNQALGRLLDYYQHTAAGVETLLAPRRRTRGAAAALTPPTEAPYLSDRVHALSWARTERANLLASLDYATRTGQQSQLIALTAAIATLLRHDGPWTGAVTRHATAVRAAHDLNDQQGEADALIDLGVMYRLSGSYPDATQTLETALDIYRDIGDRLGQANALTELGIIRWQTGDYPRAAEVLEMALDIYCSIGDQRGEASALTELGIIRWQTGDYPRAAEVLEMALDIYRDIGDRLGQANALTELGAARRQTGDYPRAAEVLETALDIYRDIGVLGGQVEVLNEMGTLHRVSGDLDQAGGYHRQALNFARMIASVGDEARALEGLGRCALADGQGAEAQVCLRQALEIFQRIGAAEAPGTAAELRALIEAN